MAVQRLINVGQGEARGDVIPVHRANRFPTVSRGFVVLGVPLAVGDQLESYPLEPAAADFLRQEPQPCLRLCRARTAHLLPESGSPIVALTMLSAHAREKGSTVNYREESDGMIHEMYVW